MIYIINIERNPDIQRRETWSDRGVTWEHKRRQGYQARAYKHIFLGKIDGTPGQNSYPPCLYRLTIFQANPRKR
jgi:hypothetical protein